MESDYKSQLNNILQKASQLKLLVVGDCILDHYVWGDATRISPEAPVPIVAIEKEDYRLGGACNVALNLKSLGVASVHLVGLWGNDHSGQTLTQLLRSQGVDFPDCCLNKAAETILKTRIIVRNQQLCRLDQERYFEKSNEVLNYLESHAWNFDGVIISDYGKGTISQELVSLLEKLRKAYGFFLAVDPKPKHDIRYNGVDLLTPNRHEALELAKIEAYKKPSLDEIISQIRTYHKTSYLAITLSEDGIALCPENQSYKVFPTRSKEVFDVSGAGDTAISALTLALCVQAQPDLAAFFANVASGIVVGKMGTATVSAEEIRQYVD